MLNPIAYIIYQLLSLYNWILIVWIILSWLMYFKIVNPYQPFVQKLNEILYLLTEPVLKRIRKYMPYINGIDLSPIALFLAINFLQYIIIYYFG